MKTARDIRILACEAAFWLAARLRPHGYEFEAVREARRRAIQDLRNPTPKMLKAAAAAMSSSKRPTSDWVSCKEKHRIRFQAMIDAAGGSAK